ncbi:hypothetical protein PVE_R2G0697 [Pseudomonas veronii 1YdBTEX2]|uniref:Uncharacterized protein n=1 Tax=Pseudomonas veronii 1YdBTEX2 TaxID=1295141 RepID=A0A1D3K8L9_PSEVE|nr:hypothetical protein PVE_R2G0697 [Pseudomonas veronii 1YdBTEX2]
MKITEDLAELLRRTRLDPEEIAERFRFLDWQEEDAKRLNAAAQQRSRRHRRSKRSSITCTATWKSSPRRPHCCACQRSLPV